MDINEKIIEAVKNYSLLYEGNATTEETQMVWQKLAKEMELQEFLINRWHTLRKNYECLYEAGQKPKANDFKYTDRMEFLLPYMSFLNTASENLLSKSSCELSLMTEKHDLLKIRQNQLNKDVQLQPYQLHHVVKKCTRNEVTKFFKMPLSDDSVQYIQVEHDDDTDDAPISNKLQFGQYENAIGSLKMIEVAFGAPMSNKLFGQDAIGSLETIEDAIEKHNKMQKSALLNDELFGQNENATGSLKTTEQAIDDIEKVNKMQKSALLNDELLGQNENASVTLKTTEEAIDDIEKVNKMQDTDVLHNEHIGDCLPNTKSATVEEEDQDPCMDIIFGELVKAMLSHMPKKQNHAMKLKIMKMLLQPSTEDK